MSVADAEKLELIRKDEKISDHEFTRELTEKGYLIEESEESRLYRNRYLDFIDSRDKDEIQIFFVTNYSCNFACTYCYQDQYNILIRSLIMRLLMHFSVMFKGICRA